MKVLIVDDVDYIRKSIGKVLEDSDFNCQTCENGRQAMDKLEKEKFDLIITDIMMPDIDGFELLDYIRDLDDQEKASTPVLAISGGSKTINSDMALNIIEEKADMILQKPFAKDDLMEAISTVMHRRKAGQSSQKDMTAEASA